MIVVSKCLFGYNCKYNGGNNDNDEVKKYCEGKDVILVCPEQAGDLPTPRVPSEIQPDGRVLSRDGQDLSEEFSLGVQREISRVLGENKAIEEAILKANSPSCGVGQVYDGTFTGKLVPGNGKFAEELMKYCSKIYTEKELNND
ncbi:MAG: DUF523 domain-containing protein [Clostridia bacterium]|nr:DUF523 domain-containing protein [Clostridia bacterium]